MNDVSPDVIYLLELLNIIFDLAVYVFVEISIFKIYWVVNYWSVAFWQSKTWNFHE